MRITFTRLVMAMLGQIVSGQIRNMTIEMSPPEWALLEPAHSALPLVSLGKRILMPLQ